METLIARHPVTPWRAGGHWPEPDGEPLVTGKTYHVVLACDLPTGFVPVTSTPINAVARALRGQYPAGYGFALLDLHGRARWIGSIEAVLAGEPAEAPLPEPKKPQRLLNDGDAEFMRKVEWEKTVERLRADGYKV